jgi:hypothetical protein
MDIYIRKNEKKQYAVIWQDSTDDSIPEACLLIEYPENDVVVIWQNDDQIILNRNKKNIKEIAKLLNKIADEL